jgi:hypothetical protein
VASKEIQIDVNSDKTDYIAVTGSKNAGLS